MGLHTGEPHVGDEGYLGIDVVRAARIASAGAGAQILISETTRALLGNTLPEGVAVLDLGERQLKDIQHEHIYEVAVDGRSTGYKAKPAESAPHKTRTDEMAARFEERIETYVAQQLENALSGGRPQIPTKLALGGLGIAFASILMLVAVAVVIVLAVKLVL
jgi:glycerate kinase